MFRRIQRLRQSGIEVYPARVNRSHTVQQVQETEAAKCTSVIAGRLVGLDLKVGRARLKDWSGTIDLALVTQKLSEILPLLSEGDLVECTGTWSQEIYNVTAVRMLVPSLRKAPEPDATNAVCIRASLLAQTRLFFEARGKTLRSAFSCSRTSATSGLFLSDAIAPQLSQTPPKIAASQNPASGACVYRKMSSSP